MAMSWNFYKGTEKNHEETKFVCRCPARSSK